jgi:methylenetetrahydrofolate reductase (NADPH)
VREAGLHDRCFIIVGVGPIVSPRAARWMRAHVPGIHIPDDVIARLERAEDPRSEGIRMCIETIQQIREIEGVAGIHLMATKKEHLIKEIVHASGVLTGRSPSLVAEAEYACPSLD